MIPLLIPLVTTLAPQVISWLFGDKAEKATQVVCDAVQKVTGQDPTTAAGAAAAHQIITADPNKALELQQALAQINAEMQAEADREKDAARQADLDTIKALITADQTQAGVNQAEASSARLFVAGWRPFVGWVCGAGLAWAFILSPMVGAAIGHPVPAIDLTELMALLQAMLGFGALRTYEKVKGIAAGH